MFNSSNTTPVRNFYTKGDTPEYRAEVRVKFPECAVDVRIIRLTNRVAFSNEFYKRVTCEEALKIKWVTTENFQFIGELCRLDAMGNSMCSGFADLPQDRPMLKFIKNEVQCDINSRWQDRLRADASNCS